MDIFSFRSRHYSLIWLVNNSNARQVRSMLVRCVYNFSGFRITRLLSVSIRFRKHLCLTIIDVKDGYRGQQGFGACGNGSMSPPVHPGPFLLFVCGGYYVHGYRGNKSNRRNLARCSFSYVTTRQRGLRVGSTSDASSFGLIHLTSTFSFLDTFFITFFELDLYTVPPFLKYFTAGTLRLKVRPFSVVPSRSSLQLAYSGPRLLGSQGRPEPEWTLNDLDLFFFFSICR